MQSGQDPQTLLRQRTGSRDITATEVLPEEQGTSGFPAWGTYTGKISLHNVWL